MNEISDSDFDFVCSLVNKAAAIAIDSDMKYLVESRLTALSRKTDYACATELLAGLRRAASPELEERVIDAMTTNETSFFRDSHPFVTLCENVLPEIARSHSDTINIWCAACSTGQEPYTIAMSILEHCPQLASRVRIKATDISKEVITKAEQGRYSRLEVNRGLPVQLLPKYFEQKGLHWEVNSALRSMVSFEQLNLIERWDGLPMMDVIFLRNVLIYFVPSVKTQVLLSTSKVLKPNGFLFLGLSETTLNLNTDYDRVNTDHSHYYKIA